MNANDAIDRIEQTISLESARLAASFVTNSDNGVDCRLAALELTRSLNFAWWRAWLGGTPEDTSSCTTMARGFNTAMSTFLTSDITTDGVPNAPTTPESSDWADTVLMRFGALRLARRVVDLFRAGLIEFLDASAEKLRFRTVDGAGLAEDDDVEASRWLMKMSMSQDEAEYQDLNGLWPPIQSLLRKNVRVFETHYIGYDTTPELDDYFLRLAILHARRSQGHEAFENEARFGGLPYSAFAAAAIALVSWSLKHMAFATELFLMNPKLNMRNILVPWSPVQWKVDSLSAQLEIDEAAARTVLDLLTGSLGQFRRFAPIHDAPTPAFVPAARDRIHFSMAGAQILPYEFLLRRLREQYPSDYFRNVEAREAMFREHLRWILPVRRVHFADKPLPLRQDGRTVTDVDALALCKSTGTLAVFQLKWQDPFGGDLRERRNRLTNLVSPANTWINTVLDWIEAFGPQAMVSLAQFSGEVPHVRRVILFVVGRYHCNFSQALPDSRAVWCTWPQLLRAVDAGGIVEDPLLYLEESLRSQREKWGGQRASGVGVLRLRDFTIETSYGEP